MLRCCAMHSAHLHGTDIAAHLACCRGLGRLELAARAAALAPGRCREGENKDRHERCSCAVKNDSRRTNTQHFCCRCVAAPLARGDKLGAYSLSEPQSGSDASNMKTYAEKNGDHYIINGTKNWVTSGQNSDFVIFFCLTNKEAGSKGISAFIIGKGTPGLSMGKKENKLGIRASDTCELYFENCKVPIENVLGEVGQGGPIAFNVLYTGRYKLGVTTVAGAKYTISAALDFAKGLQKKYDDTQTKFDTTDEKYLKEFDARVCCWVREAWPLLVFQIRCAFRPPLFNAWCVWLAAVPFSALAL